MTNKNSSKLTRAMKVAVKPPIPKSTVKPYTGDDFLKHHIRKNYWLKRIQILQRDCRGALSDGIKYFTFCSRYAYDVRFFSQKNVLNSSFPFGFVEFEKQDFDFLNDQFVNRKFRTAKGFYGSLADISTSTSHKDYGSFWSTFPYDVINLDYLGDILKSSSNDGRIDVNDFYAIQAIVSQQSLLRRPYELWITLRAKSGRSDPSIKQELRKLIDHNLKEHQTFKEDFEKSTHKTAAKDLDDESLCLIGYIKWLCFVCNKHNSSINTSKLEIIKYERTDKDNVQYYLYNIFLRIEPYDKLASIPSPVGDAVEYCNAEYIKGIKSSFFSPKDVGVEYEKLLKEQKDILKKEMKELFEQYTEDNNGFI